MNRARTTTVDIEEAEIAYLAEIIEVYRRMPAVPRIHRQVTAVAAKRFVNRAVKALQSTEAMTPA